MAMMQNKWLSLWMNELWIEKMRWVSLLFLLLLFFEKIGLALHIEFRYGYRSLYELHFLYRTTQTHNTQKTRIDRTSSELWAELLLITFILAKIYFDQCLHFVNSQYLAGTCIVFFHCCVKTEWNDSRNLSIEDSIWYWGLYSPLGWI